jgi:hypothetical protein
MEEVAAREDSTGSTAHSTAAGCASRSGQAGGPDLVQAISGVAGMIGSYSIDVHASPQNRARLLQVTMH